MIALLSSPRATTWPHFTPHPPTHQGKYGPNVAFFLTIALKAQGLGPGNDVEGLSTLGFMRLGKGREKRLWADLTIGPEA